MTDQPLQTHDASTGLDRIAAWLKGREAYVLLAGVVLQFAVLGSMIAFRALPHMTGQTILLRVVPVDPRDMFRGDYVILGYDFTRQWPAGMIPRTQEPQGTPVYIWLAPEGDGLHWRTQQVDRSPPPAGQPYIRGHVGTLGIEAGIESFYVQEGKGREYEKAIGRRQLSAEVAVTADGQAALRSLKIID